MAVRKCQKHCRVLKVQMNDIPLNKNKTDMKNLKPEEREVTLTSVGGHGCSVIAEANFLAQGPNVVRLDTAPARC